LDFNKVEDLISRAQADALSLGSPGSCTGGIKPSPIIDNDNNPIFACKNGGTILQKKVYVKMLDISRE
jgi:hypothetical protein